MKTIDWTEPMRIIRLFPGDRVHLLDRHHPISRGFLLGHEWTVLRHSQHHGRREVLLFTRPMEKGEYVSVRANSVRLAYRPLRNHVRAFMHQLFSNEQV